MSEVKKLESSSNVVKLETNSSIGEIWLIDELKVSLSHSVMVGLTISFDDDDRKSIDLTLISSEVSRFEQSDFTYEHDDIEKDPNAKRILPKIRGLYSVEESEFLNETIIKYANEYPSGKKSNLQHFMILTGTEVINIVANQQARIIFENEDINAELTELKEK